MGTQSLGPHANHMLGCALRAWVVAAPSTCSASLRFLTAHSLLCRINYCRLRTLLTTARICRMAAHRPHDSTSLVDDGRASTHPVGRTIPAASCRVPSGSPEQRSQAVSIVSSSPKCGSLRVTSSLLLVSLYFDQHRLASSGDVRAGAAIYPLA